jgi:archaellum biogenesis ATPase FlaH
MAKEYTVGVQKLFLEMMLQDSQSYVRVQNIYNPENFDRTLRDAAKFIASHTDEYQIMPTAAQIKAVCSTELLPLPDLGEGHTDWFLSEFEGFTKRQELERAILKAADLLEQGDYGPVEQLIKDAVQISLTKDMGIDYFANPAERINRYFNNGGQVSTGWPQLDRILYGGFSRGELNIFAGGSGSGKSLVMMNMALNWLQVGLNGVYISLELSEELTSLRTDAMLTGTGTKYIRKSIDESALKISVSGKQKNMGRYQVKSLPAQSNVNDIRAYLKEFQIKTGHSVDFIMVDYLDLLMPLNAKVSVENLFTKDKLVSEELRNLARELKIIMVTASQLNRSAVDEAEFDHSHISGGISKINTADNVFGIFTSRSMRERGKYQIQCMKSRSSTGVGMKVDLDYNIESMRITDADDGSGSSSPGGPPQVSNIMAQIKGKRLEGSGSGLAQEKPRSAGATPPWDHTPKATGTASSTVLKNMLNAMKNKSE